MATALALFQLLSTLRMYGRARLRRSKPSWLLAHGWSGTAAFGVSLPVAHHLWSLGFTTVDLPALPRG